ncbi:hypothetical protein HID58_033894 [Brassica napus]|uniref:Uncharacterized protein n=3 Tax=Brassica TaxID=3705 RepID=A0ABQ8C0M6_BRANA|nr:hypothetical protein HID58_033894 [Brassica napus]
MILEVIPELTVCDFLMEKLWEMDVDKSQIRLENFSSPMKPAAEETWRRRHEISGGKNKKFTRFDGILLGPGLQSGKIFDDSSN